jgi:hypothetical protein
MNRDGVVRIVRDSKSQVDSVWTPLRDVTTDALHGSAESPDKSMSKEQMQQTPGADRLGSRWPIQTTALALLAGCGLLACGSEGSGEHSPPGGDLPASVYTAPPAPAAPNPSPDESAAPDDSAPADDADGNTDGVITEVGGIAPSEAPAASGTTPVPTGMDPSAPPASDVPPATEMPPAEPPAPSDEPAVPPPAVCDISANLRWSSSGPLIAPVSNATHNLVSIKDPTVIFYNDRWHVYATVANTAGEWNMVYLNFADWSEADTAPQYYMDQTPGLNGYHCAPQIFYFAPQNLWYLIYQSQPPQYSTTTDPSRPESWTRPQNFFAAEPAVVTQNKGAGFWIDYWNICDDNNCYLFSEDDNGHVYRSQTTLQNFPAGFGNTVIILQDANRFNLFEASNIYKLKGLNKYLAMVEAAGANGRFFRSWTADRLDGNWTPLYDTEQNPFAGGTNVTFEAGAWTQDISHGEMLRDSNDQTLTIDACNLSYLYQGRNPNQNNADYSQLPYRLGLLTATSAPVVVPSP